MKFDVLNRWSGEIQFTADLECDENAKTSVKLGHAVKWAIANDANLRDANLSNADLRDADLSGANLSGANLRGANLRGVDLCDANLRDANLSGADLRDAELCGAELCYANLCYANLCGAKLCSANLCGANLRGANLSGVDLCDAELGGANLCDADLCYAKNTPVVIHWLPWTTYIYTDYVQIGCQRISRHEIETWENSIGHEQWKEFFPFKKVIIAVWEYAFPSEEHDKMLLDALPLNTEE